MLKRIALLATALMILVPAICAYAEEKPKGTVTKSASTATHKPASHGSGHAGLQHRPNTPREANPGSGKKLTLTKQRNSASPQLLDAPWKAERFDTVKAIPPAPPEK